MAFIWNLILILLTYAVCSPIMLLILSGIALAAETDFGQSYITAFLLSTGLSFPPWLPLVLTYCAVMTLIGIVGAIFIMLPPTWALFRFFLGIRKPNAREDAQIQAALDYMERRCGKNLSSRYTFRVQQYPLNAFAMGWKDIIITTESLSKLNTPQLAGFIAHEMGHHTHGDPKTLIFINSLFAVFNLSTLFLQCISWICSAFCRVPIIGIGFIIVSLFISLLMIVVRILYSIPYKFLNLTLSRQIEFAADAHAAKLGLGEELISGLQLLTEEYGDTPLFAVPFMDHPRNKSRIRRLEKFLEEERQREINRAVLGR